jgi:peptide/nickel transport system substrate-binding protein
MVGTRQGDRVLGQAKACRKESYKEEEPKMRKSVALLSVLVLLIPVLMACGGTPAPAETEPTQVPATQEVAPTEATGPTGSIVIAIGGDPSTLDPQVADDGNERAVNDNIYETLVARNPETMELVPGLAESWAQVDATTWEVKLRQGITFHNGEPFNAEAAAFSINRVINPDFKSEQISFFSTIKEGKVVDDSTIQVITDGPDPTLPARLYWLKIVPPKYAADANFGTNPVGTGPYKFVEWVRDDHVDLVANADYWGTKPTIAEVRIRPIKEEVTRLAALKAGEVDFVRSLIPEYVNEVPKVASTPGIEFPWLRLNCLVGPLTDKRLRQAINYAINKDELAESLYSGYAVPADGQLLTTGHFGYNPDLKAYPYDPDKAKALIQEAGYANEELELIGEAGRWLKDKELIEAVAGQLREVGLNVTVNIVEWSQWLDLLFAGADKAPTIQFSSNDNALLDADRTVSALFHSTGSQTAYSNPELDQLIDAARSETDMAKREDLYHQVTQIVYDDAVIGFLLNLKDIYGMTDRVEWTPRRDGKVLVIEMTLTE